MNQKGKDEPESVNPIDLQQFYYECFGDRDWNIYYQNEHIFLKRNIGYSIFGSPNDLKDDLIQNTTTGYNKKQNKQINEVYDAIIHNHFLEDSTVIFIRIIFICCKLNNKQKSVIVEPVFILKKCQNEDKVSSETNCKIYIDSNARVYKSWELYLRNNRLPKCEMTFPKNGQYYGEIIEDTDEIRVVVETCQSPACTVGAKVLEGADTAGTVVSIGATVTCVAAAIPGIAVAPALLAASAIGGIGVGLYSVGRSVQTLVDRKKHAQSIGLNNSESRWCWLNTTIGVLGASTSAASGLLTRAASRGVEISKAAQIAFNTLTTANIAGSATNLALCGYNIIDKLINKEPISALEVFQVASSALFFHNSVSNFRTAKTIITETQSNILIEYETRLRSNKYRRLFRKAQLESRRLKGDISGNAEIISGISNINDPDNFFAGLARINKDLNQNGGRYTITPEGKIEINSNYIVDPMEFANVTKGDRVNIIKNLPAYVKTTHNTTKITQTTFNAKQFFISTCLEKLLLNLPKISKIVQELINNKFDLDTITVLFKDYSEDVISMFVDILVEFLNEIKGDIDNFKKLHPMVSFAVGACQYLIHFIQQLAVVKNSELTHVLVTAFYDKNSIHASFMADLKDNFQIWLKNQIKKLQLMDFCENFNEINKIKQKKVCEVCKGCYFESIK